MGNMHNYEIVPRCSRRLWWPEFLTPTIEERYRLARQILREWQATPQCVQLSLRIVLDLDATSDIAYRVPAEELRSRTQPWQNLPKIALCSECGSRHRAGVVQRMVPLEPPQYSDVFKERNPSVIIQPQQLESNVTNNNMSSQQPQASSSSGHATVINAPAFQPEQRRRSRPYWHYNCPDWPTPPKAARQSAATISASESSNIGVDDSPPPVLQRQIAVEDDFHSATSESEPPSMLDWLGIDGLFHQSSTCSFNENDRHSAPSEVEPVYDRMTIMEEMEMEVSTAELEQSEALTRGEEL